MDSHATPALISDAASGRDGVAPARTRDQTPRHRATAVRIDHVSKRYVIERRSANYLRDRLTGAFSRLNPFRRGPDPLHRDFLALDDVSFEIKEGEAVGIIGRNGAGKSTMLKLLAGVSRPTVGEVSVSGRVAPLIEVGAGFHPELSGRENVYLNGSIMGLRKADIDKAFDDIVRFAELETFIDTPVKHYSSGMYMRLGFSIAVHTRPDIYLIDEVLAVGDAAFQDRCIAALAAHKAAGKTLILVSHALNQVEQLCDRCIYLRNGMVRYDGVPALAIRAYRLDLRTGSPVPASSEESLGSRAAIADVATLDADGEPEASFETFDEVAVRVAYRVYEQLHGQLSVVVTIHGPLGEAVTTLFSTAVGFVPPTALGEHTVVCRIPRLPLCAGAYSLSVSLVEVLPSWMIMDMHWQRYRFGVRSEHRQGHGVLSLEAEWTTP